MKRFVSEFDGLQDRYIIEHPAEQPTGPLVFYLHGGMSHAEQGFCDEYDWCFRKLRNEVMARNGVYVSPEYRGNSWMSAAAEADVVQLVRDIKEDFGLDRVVLTGGSMGGTSVLIHASHRPETVDGVVALCPATDMKALWTDLAGRRQPMFDILAGSIVDAYGGTPAQVPEEYAYRSSVEQVKHLTMPIAMRHGDADDLLPAWHSRWLVAALRNRGTPVRYDEIPGGGHDSPTVDTPWREYLDFVLQSG